MTRKRYSGAPFGTQTPRFDVSGVHPQNKLPGTYTQAPYCKKLNAPEVTLLGPGAYAVHTITGDFSQTSVTSRAQGPNWERAFDSAKFNAIPHMLYRDSWAHKRELKQLMGPGKYETKDFVALSDQKPSSQRGVCQMGESRFPRENVFLSNLPGPGTYGKGGVPWAAQEKRSRQSTSTVGMMESAPRDYCTERDVGSGLAPCRYSFPSSTEAMVNKTVSLRGPYDLFSGDRYELPQHVLDKRTMGPGKYDLKTFTDEWNCENLVKHGRFGKQVQYPEQPTERIYCSTLSQCPRPKTEPGPGYYFRGGRMRTHSAPSSSASSSVSGRHPFNSSAKRFDRRALQNFSGNVNPVGIGQYDLRHWHNCQHSFGSVNIFTSRTPRLPPRVDAPRERLLDERLRPKSVSANRKLFEAIVLEAPC